MKDIVEVRVNTMYGTFAAGLTIDPLLLQQFAPMRISEDPALCVVTGDISTEQAKIIIKERSKAAEHLGRELARMILDAMKSNDTLNGYPVEK